MCICKTVDLLGDEAHDIAPMPVPFPDLIERHMMPFEWRTYAENQLMTFEILRRFQEKDVNLHGILLRKKHSRAREILARLRDNATIACVRQLVQYRNGIVSDEVAMQAYVIDHIGVIPWWQ